MIKFGNENNDMNSAPFLIKTIEEMDNEVKFIVALSMKGKQGCGINEEDDSALGKILSECVPIYPDEDNLYEILFDNYVFHITRNESYRTWIPARTHSEIAEQFLHYASLAKCVCKQSRLARCNREIPRVTNRRFVRRVYFALRD